MKAGLLAAIREQNKVFYGMVVAQAQKVDVAGDEIVFTFAPAHKHLRGQLDGKKAWVEQLAVSAAGRKMTVVTRESAPVAAPTAPDEAAKRRAALEAQVKNEPTVQAVLDVFGGAIEDIEELQ